jgi:hypothetical protein
VIQASEGIVAFNTPANSKAFSLHPFGFTAIGPGQFSPITPGVSWQMWDDSSGADIGIAFSYYMMRKNIRFHRIAFAKTGRIAYGTTVDATFLGSTRKFMNIERAYYDANESSGWVQSGGAGPALLIPWV